MSNGRGNRRWSGRCRSIGKRKMSQLLPRPAGSLTTVIFMNGALLQDFLFQGEKGTVDRGGRVWPLAVRTTWRISVTVRVERTATCRTDGLGRPTIFLGVTKFMALATPSREGHISPNRVHGKTKFYLGRKGTEKVSNRRGFGLEGSSLRGGNR